MKTALSLLPVALIGSAPALAAGPPYPSKIIRMIVAYSAGGTGELLGQRVLIDTVSTR